MEDQNGNVIANKTAPPLKESDHTTQNGEEFTFGWGKIRPKSLKFLNSPVWFLVVFSVYNLFQGIAAWAMPSLVLPSIERRFGFSSKELGLIAASNDVSALLLVVFISYYGDYGNKIKWIAGGATVTGLGIIVFALPHFMVGRYHPGSSHFDSLCNKGNTTMAQCVEKNSGGEWYYLAVFVIAMLIMGAGTAPYFSLFVAYLDENIEPKSLPLYLGTWFVVQFTAPGIGFTIGGKFLSIYVDINQPDGFDLTPKDPRWIGAWWIGFFVFGVAIILCSIIMLGFPREMPGARQRRQNHILEGNIKQSNDTGSTPSLKNIPGELKKLFKNPTFLFNSLAFTSLLFFIGAMTSFFPKFLRMKFGLGPEETGYVMSIISISGSVVGSIFGSMIVRMFSLKTACKKAAATCTIFNLLAIGGTLIYLIPACINTNLAGVTEQDFRPNMNRTQTNTAVNGILKSLCNKKCGCSLKSFSPVCGTNNLTYLDSCHAGCTHRLSKEIFSNCSCIPGKTSKEHGTATLGYCDRQCKNLVIFAVIGAISSALRFTTIVPAKTVLLRCVPDNKRAFASGVNYVMFKTFGLLPSPLIFGHIVDESCRLWQNVCGKRGRCFDYDITSLSRSIAFYGLCSSVMTTIFYFWCWYFCKPFKRVEITAKVNEGAEPDETRF